MKTVILYAPQGWGKSTHAELFRLAFGCESVVDEYAPQDPLTPGALHLTNCVPTESPSHWEEADSLVEVKPSRRSTQ